ncbi:MAG: hypothetical protein K6L76_03120 [Agarilytica sp.]
MSNVAIMGAYHSQFGALIEKNRETGEIKDLKSIYELLLEAGRGAIEDSGLDSSEIDGVWIGSCSPASFTSQEHLAAVGVEIDPEGLLFKPMSRMEGACASSSVALHNAIYAVESGRFENVLVIGVEKMNLCKTADVTRILSYSSYYPEEGAMGMTFPGLFAEFAKGYQTQYNFSDDQMREMLACLSARGYTYGAKNSIAHFGPGGLADKKKLFTTQSILDLPLDDGRSNPMIAPPLRLHDCSLVTDGAAALVISNADNVRKKKDKVVRFAGIGHAQDRMPLSKKSNMHELLGAKHAVLRAYNEAGINADDLDVAEVHDCFTINQLLCTEALGLSAGGKSGIEFLEGRFSHQDAACGVNLSGGLKAKGHPVGATGVSMHLHVYRQLIGDPLGEKYHKDAEVGAVLNVGGSAATNCASILRREQ